MPTFVRHRGVARYLLPGETPAAEIRYHPIVLAKPALIALVATAIALWLDMSVSMAQSGILKYVWFLWVTVCLWFAWQWIEWRYTQVVATDKRIVLFEGWINHKVSMMPLTKVTDMGYHRTLLGRLLGYGTFILESAGQDQALSQISYVPNPDTNYRAICTVVFGLGSPTRDDEPAWETSQDDGAGDEYDDSWAPPSDASIYRSPDLLRRDQEADTGELPPYDPYGY